jgi:hypothetical protein
MRLKASTPIPSAPRPLVRSAVPRAQLTPVVASSHLPDIDLAAGETKTIGRGTRADVIIDDPSLSRLHARLTLDSAGALHVEDLESTNGVVINGIPHARGLVQSGDLVSFGFVEYMLVARDAPAPDVIAPTFVRVQTSHGALRVAEHVVLEALLDTSRELMAFADLPALLERVLDRLQTILKPDRAAILLVDPSSGAVTPRAVWPRGAYTSVSEFASSTVIREALSSQDTLIVYDPASNPRLQRAASMVCASVHSAICIPLVGRTGAIGVLYADRVGAAELFTPELVQYASAFASCAATALETAQLYDERERHFRATLEAFAKATDARDPYTAGHSERVTAYALALGRAGGLPDGDLETLRRAGMLHDIGKVGVPDAILRKAGPLTAEERAAIEAHPMIGYRMLETLPFLAEALHGVRHHHERWDGRGYPDGLAGTGIHLHARLLAVADTYDAMTSARPYRGPLPRDEAVRRLRAERGTQFDPAAIELFEAVEPEFHALRER